MTGADEPDMYYKQPGHPLSPAADKGGRFKVILCGNLIYLKLV